MHALVAAARRFDGRASQRVFTCCKLLQAATSCHNSNSNNNDTIDYLCAHVNDVARMGTNSQPLHARARTNQTSRAS